MDSLLRARRRLSVLTTAAIASAGLFGLTPTVDAQTFTWTPSATLAWDTTTANWTGAGSTWVNSNTSDAVFSTSANGLVGVTVPITVNNISVINRDRQIDNVGGSLVFAGASAGIDVAATHVLSLDLPVGGSVGFTKTGAGQVVIGDGPSTYTGATTINAGLLALGVSDCLPTSTVVSVANTATLSLAPIQQIAGLTGGGRVEARAGAGVRNLHIANTSAATFSGVISNGFNANGAAITKSGSGVQTLGGTASNTYTGGTTITGGVLVAAKNDALGSGTVSITNSTLALLDGPILNGGEITVGGTVPAGRAGNIEALTSTSVVNNAVTLTGSATLAATNSILVFTNSINAVNHSLTFNTPGSGVIFTGNATGTGTGNALIKIGTGHLFTGGTQTFAGRAVINGGTFGVQNTSAVQTVGLRVATEGNTGAVTVDGLLDVSSFVTVGDSLSGVGAGGNGRLDVNDGGTMRVSGGAKLAVGWVNAIGTLNLNKGGVLEVGGTDGIFKHATATTSFNLAGGTLRVIGSNLTSSVPMTLTAASALNTDSLNATLAGVLSGVGALTKTGDGTLALTAANTFTGGLHMTAGVVTASQDANLGQPTRPISFDGGTLRTSAGFAMDRTWLMLGNGTIEVVTGTINQQQHIDEIGTLTKTGPGTLSVRALRNGGAIVSNGTLAIAAGGDADHASRIGALTIGAARLDLADNDLVLTSSSLAAIQAMINSARNGGSWNGNGITSSAAASATPKNTTLGVLTGAEYIPIAGATFDGFTVTNTDVLVKYTYYGDTDFNGQVNFDDYARADAGFNSGSTGWLNGDFDGSGGVNFDDYALIDLSFNTQSGTLIRAMNWLEGEDRSMRGMNDPALQKVVEHYQQFGNGYATSFLQAVPEPTSALAICGLVACVGTRRRRQ